ncbi:MAG: hypothetical protein J5616_06090 [Bacteroidaceae bacterium]|nr:hypothetical protein [Bacteroidaceae bacterium]
MTTHKNLPRGLRNRNPLNIRKSDQLWAGQTGNDGKFCIFLSNEYGYRAAFRILKTYNTKYHIYSVREIISRWAPPNDGNNTRGYIQRVCALSGLRETDLIVVQPSDGDPYNVVMLVWAMAIVENGERYKKLIDRGEIYKGYELAFGRK